MRITKLSWSLPFISWLMIGATEADSTPLTLTLATQKALTQHPLLSLRYDAIDTQKAVADQSSYWSNPQLSYSRQNLNNDQLTGTDGPADTLVLTQAIELGGKRGARIDRAEQLVRLRELEWAQARADIAAETRRRFVDAMLANARLTIERDLLVVSEQTAHAAQEKVRAGKVPPIEYTKAAIHLTSARAQQAQTLRERDTALQRLGLLWADSESNFTIDDGALAIDLNLPSLSVLQSQLATSPQWQYSEANLAQRDAELNLAQAQAYPDLSLSIGRTTFSDLNESSDQVGISFNVPLFDRNQGGKAEARLKRNEAQAESQLRHRESELALNDLHRHLLISQSEIAVLRKELLPAADDVYRATLVAYSAGKLGILDVLDAQRTNSDLHQQYLRNVQEFHYRLADLEHLLGVSLDALNK